MTGHITLYHNYLYIYHNYLYISLYILLTKKILLYAIKTFAAGDWRGITFIIHGCYHSNYAYALACALKFHSIGKVHFIDFNGAISMKISSLQTSANKC